MSNIKIFTLSIILLGVFNMHAQTKYGMGSNFDLDLYKKAELADMEGLGFATDIPSSFSLQKYAPHVGNQGQYGTCVGWSTAYSALTIQRAAALDITNTDFITASAFCPYFVYLQIHDNYQDYSCRIGTYLYNAMTSFRNVGSKRFLAPAYDCGEKIPQNTIDNAKFSRIKSFKKLFGYPDDMDWSYENFFSLDMDKSTPVKQAIAAGYAIPFGMFVPTTFFDVVGIDLWEPSQEELDALPNIYVGGHAMSIIGYDDEKYGGALLVQNSWGTEWGDQGYFWVKYEHFDIFGYEAYYFELYDEILPETGCIMGDCDNNYSRIIFDSGEMYEGEFKDGQYNGEGIYTWPSGHAYGGMWKDGMRHGIGTSYGPGNIIHTGNWENDQPVDYDVYVADSSGCVEDDCENGWGVMKYTSGDSYTGEFVLGYRNGYGTYTYSDGFKLEGTWLLDQLDGYGTIKYVDNYYYVGEFLNDQINGYGIRYGWGEYEAGLWIDNMLNTDEEVIGFGGRTLNNSGKVKKGKMSTAAAISGCLDGDCNEGKGTLMYENGDKYTGYFKNGKPDSFGRYEWASGTSYDGRWIGGKMDGYGKTTWTEGDFYMGEYRYGMQDGYGIYVTSDTYTPGRWDAGVYLEGETSLGFADVNDGNEPKASFEGLGISPGIVKVILAVAAKSPTSAK